MRIYDILNTILRTVLGCVERSNEIDEACEGCPRTIDFVSLKLVGSSISQLRTKTLYQYPPKKLFGSKR